MRRAARRAPPPPPAEPRAKVLTAELVVAETPAEALAARQAERQRAYDYARAERAPATLRAYKDDYAAFAKWCAERGESSLPASEGTIADYLAFLADSGRKPAGIGRVLAGIAFAHRETGHGWEKGERPGVSRVMRGIKNQLGVAPVKKKAISDEDLVRMIATLDLSPAFDEWCKTGVGERPALERPATQLSGLRDRALLTFLWLSAVRRSEASAIDHDALEPSRDGYVVHIRRGKTDQSGKGRIAILDYARDTRICPILAVRAWLAAAGITEGAVFRAVRDGKVRGRLQGRDVARIVQRTIARLGLDATRYGAHSTRAGFMTTAYRKGKSLRACMKQSGHKSETVARGYIQIEDAREENGAIGLI